MNFDNDVLTRAQERTRETGIFINHEDLLPVLVELLDNLSTQELAKVYTAYQNNTLPSTAYARGQVKNEEYVNDPANKYRTVEDLMVDGIGQEFFTHDFNYDERLGSLELNEKARELINFVNRRFAITAVGSGSVLSPETANYPTDEIALGNSYDNSVLPQPATPSIAQPPVE